LGAPRLLTHLAGNALLIFAAAAGLGAYARAARRRSELLAKANKAEAPAG